MDGVLGWKAEDFTLVSAETVDYGPVDPAVEYFRKEVYPFLAPDYSLLPSMGFVGRHSLGF